MKDFSGNPAVQVSRTVEVVIPQISVSFGSDKSGLEAARFTSWSGEGFDPNNRGVLALGYFDTGLDVEHSAETENIDDLLAGFRLLHESTFDGEDDPGVLHAFGSRDEDGVGQVPYLLLLAGVDSFASASIAAEYGLFTHSEFGTLLGGGYPNPVEHTFARNSYDTILLGREITAGGLGGASAFTTQRVPLDRGAPSIVLNGDPSLILAVGTDYEEMGATVTDTEDGDLTHLLEITGSVDSSSIGLYTIRYNATDLTGNEAPETVRTVRVAAPPEGVSISQSAFDENLPAGTVVGVLSVFDQDSDETHQISLTSDENFASNELFTIEANQLVTTTSFDHESQSELEIELLVTDRYGLTLEKSISLMVRDVNEAPTSLSIDSATITENLPAGSTVGTLQWKTLMRERLTRLRWQMEPSI